MAAPERVQLHVYDLSDGMAARVSETLCGVHVDGIWHTGIVVYGQEYFYGDGVNRRRAGETRYGTPLRVENIGETALDRRTFEDFLRSISDRYQSHQYHLITHNCNTFTAECAEFLTGQSIPGYITSLPENVMNTPMGAMFRPMIDRMMPATAHISGAASKRQLARSTEPVVETRASLRAALDAVARCTDAPLAPALTDPDADPDHVWEALQMAAESVNTAHLFAVLDLVRLWWATPAAGRWLERDRNARNAAALLCRAAERMAEAPRSHAAHPNRLMFLRALGNLFASPGGAALAVDDVLCPTALPTVIEGLTSSHADVRCAAAGVAHNYALHLPKTLDEDLITLLTAAVSAVEAESHQETEWRLLLAVAHFLEANPDAVALATSLHFNPLAHYREQAPPKMQAVVTELEAIMEQPLVVYD